MDIQRQKLKLNKDLYLNQQVHGHVLAKELEQQLLLVLMKKMCIRDSYNLFRTLQGKEDPKFTTLLVARFNLIPELNRLIDREISLADEGKQGRIILKMNALQAVSYTHLLLLYQVTIPYSVNR